MTETSPSPLSLDERLYIEMSANLRREAQWLETKLVNLAVPKGLPEYVASIEKILKQVQEDAAGDENLAAFTDKQAEYLAPDWPDKVEKCLKDISYWSEIGAPNMCQFLYAELAKAAQIRGEAFLLWLAAAKKERELARKRDLPQQTANAFLADAMVLGVEKRALRAARKPTSEQVSAEIATTTSEQERSQLVAQYALVLSESEREHFLETLPLELQEQVALELDVSVASVLHQSFIVPKTPEEGQRRAVRMRLFSNLRELLAGSEQADRLTSKFVAEALGAMGEDSKQLLLEAIREHEAVINSTGEITHLPRVIKVLLDHFDDHRGNDSTLRLAADRSISPHLARYLFRKLVKREYVDQAVGAWLDDSANGVSESKKLAVLQAVITDLGVMPSLEICEYIATDKNWKLKEFVELNELIPIEERVWLIKESQTEFAGFQDHISLISFLANDKHKAMIFFLLHGGSDRFKLINNYSFEQFTSMLEKITELKEHGEPVHRFGESLRQAGVSESEIKIILSRLRAGKFPLTNLEQAYQLLNFEVSGNAAVQNANAELGQILGKNQLGVVLLFPLYREFLSEQHEHQFDEELGTATTFNARAELLATIEREFPEFKERAKATLKQRWLQFGEKMLLEVSIEDVLEGDQLLVQGEQILPRLDTKRIDLRQANQELLVALRGDNQELVRLRSEIKKKKKALLGLQTGVEKQPDEQKKAELTVKIAEIQAELDELDQKLTELGRTFVSDARFAGLSEQEKKMEIERLGKELVALAEKSASAIFTYLVMQVLGKKEWVEVDENGKEQLKEQDRLTEDDINLITELESHLQGPFQQISDATKYYSNLHGETTKRQEVALHWVDKRERLMNIVRFADSKICCFSSINYKMEVAHHVPNEYWVASIVADPLSFVLSIELPTSAGSIGTEKQHSFVQNEGFIFGSFGLDEDNKPVILLNGIYYAPGIAKEQQTETFLAAVEKIFAHFPLHAIAIASQHGGMVKMPPGWSNDPVEWTRLRALDDGRGQPETIIYDDLGTDKDLNQPHQYSGHVRHKKLRDG